MSGIELPKAVVDEIYRQLTERGFKEGEERGLFCPKCHALVWSTSDDISHHNCNQVEAW